MLFADYSELGRRQTCLRTKRGERRSRLDPLAGRQQAPFGEDEWALEMGEGWRKEGDGTRKV